MLQKIILVSIFRVRNIPLPAISGHSAFPFWRSASASTQSHLRTRRPWSSFSGNKLPKRWWARPDRGWPRRILEPPELLAWSRWPSSSSSSTSSTSRRRGFPQKSSLKTWETLSTGVSRRTRVRGLIWQPLWWAVESLIDFGFSLNLVLGSLNFNFRLFLYNKHYINVSWDGVKSSLGYSVLTIFSQCRYRYIGIRCHRCRILIHNFS